MKDKKVRKIASVLAVCVVLRGRVGIILFKRISSSGIYSYQIGRVKNRKRKQGKRLSVHYTIDKDYEPELTCQFEFVEKENGKNASDYVSALIYPSKHIVYLTCEKSFENSIRFLLLDKDHPEIYAERILDYSNEVFYETDAQIISDRIEDGKPILYDAIRTGYVDGEPIEKKKADIECTLTFENYPILNLLDGSPKEDGPYFYGNVSYDGKEKLGDRKKERSKSVEQYFRTLCDGKTPFSFAERKELRTFSYFGKDNGVTRKKNSIFFGYLFFKNYRIQTEKNRIPLVFAIKEGEDEIVKKELPFSKVPDWLEKIEVGSDKIIF